MKKNPTSFHQAEKEIQESLLLSRRHFLTTMSGVASGLVLPQFTFSTQALADDLPLIGGVSILQGYTDRSSTTFTLVVPADSEYAYRALNGSLEIKPLERKRTHMFKSPHAVDEIHFDGLELGVDYRLQVLQKNGSVVDQRHFSTLDIDKTAPRIALISCMNDLVQTSQALMWSKVADQKPDALFLVGDTFYADSPLEVALGWPASPKKLWKRHVVSRQRVMLYYLSRLIPTFTVWDDHDFGGNDQTATYAHKEISKEIYRAFFSLSTSSPRVERGPGVAFRLDAFGQRYLFLDDRSFRITKPKDGPVTHWGDEQQHWLTREVRNAQNPVWLLNGSMFFGAYRDKGESVERQTPESLEVMKDAVRACNHPVVLGTGDVHYSEIQAIPKSVFGYKTHELVSSAIHSASAGATLTNNPWRMDSYGFSNFLMTETRVTSSQSLEIDTTCVGTLASSVFRHQLKIQR